VHFRGVSDNWARKDYSNAIELLRGVCDDCIGGEWEELAGYTIGEILQQSLHSYDRAGQTFERLYTKFPNGDLALPARMAAADCAQAAGVDVSELLKLYAEVVERGADTEIEATAQLKIGFIHLLADRLEDATTAFRKVVNDFPDGFAKNNALYALGYCYEKARRLAEARRTYQTILDVTVGPEPPDPIYPDCFPQAWDLLLADWKQVVEAGRRGPDMPGVWVDATMEGYPQIRRLDLQKFAQWQLRAYPKTRIHAIIRCDHSTHHSNDWSTDSNGKIKASSDDRAAAGRSLGRDKAPAAAGKTTRHPGPACRALSQSTRRHSVRAAHRLPMEGGAQRVRIRQHLP